MWANRTGPTTRVSFSFSFFIKSFLAFFRVEIGNNKPNSGYGTDMGVDTSLFIR